MPAFYLVLQEKIPGADATSLSECLDKARPSTFSASEEEMAGFLVEGGADVNLPEEKWFPAEEGLKTNAALLKALADAPSIEGPILSAELRQFQQVLEGAESRNVRWHLGIDY